MIPSRLLGVLAGGLLAIGGWSGWTLAAEPVRSPSASEIRAQLTPRHYTTLASELPAAVAKIHHRDGERFQAGDPLLDLDCVIQEAQLVKAQAAQTASERVLAANRRLLALQSVGALEVANAQAEAAKNQAEVQVMTATVSKCSYRAPFSGRVAEQKVREKQFVQIGQPLLEILDDSLLELEFIVPSRWLAWLQPGWHGKVVIDETGRTYPIQISRIGARVDAVSQSVKVVGEVAGQFPELIAGMSGKVELAPPGQPP